jgi:hypothetical protein
MCLWITNNLAQILEVHRFGFESINAFELILLEGAMGLAL